MGLVTLPEVNDPLDPPADGEQQLTPEQQEAANQETIEGYSPDAPDYEDVMMAEQIRAEQAQQQQQVQPGQQQPVQQQLPGFPPAQQPAQQQQAQQAQPGDEVAQLRAQNAQLMQQMNLMGQQMQATGGLAGLQSQLGLPPVVPQQVGQQSQQQQAQQPTAEEELADILLTDEELDTAMDRPEVINKAIKRMYDKVTTRVANTQQTVAPQVQRQVQAMNYAQSVANNFRTQNPDLGTPYAQQLVQTNFASLVQQRQMAGIPTDPATALEEAGNYARAQLGMPPKQVGAQLQNTAQPQARQPASQRQAGRPTLPGAGTARQPQARFTQRTPQQQMMDEI